MPIYSCYSFRLLPTLVSTEIRLDVHGHGRFNCACHIFDGGYNEVPAYVVGVGVR